jgi:hypothetical protein
MGLRFIGLRCRCLQDEFDVRNGRRGWPSLATPFLLYDLIADVSTNDGGVSSKGNRPG